MHNKIKIYKKSATNKFERLGYYPTDVGRSKEQAISIAKGYPKEYGVVIIETAKKTGNQQVFPYHIWAKKGVN